VIDGDLRFRRNKVPPKILSSLTGNASVGVVQNPGGTKKDLAYAGYTDVQMGFAAPIVIKDPNGNGILSDASGALTKTAFWASVNYVHYPQTGNDIACFLSTDPGGGGVAGCLGDGNQFSFPGAWLDVFNIWQTLAFVDVDGKPDLGPDFCLRSPSGVQCGLAVGAGLFSLKQWDTTFTDAAGWSGSPAYWSTIRFADVNGDKKTDVCGRNGNGVICELSDGTKFGAASLWSDVFNDPGGWAAFPSYYSTIQFPDRNGDGKADDCGRSPGDHVCGMSTGTSFQVTSWDDYYTDLGPWDDDPSYWATIQYADIDGDGKKDVCGRAQNGIVCRRSTGTTFGPVELWGPGFEDAGGWAGNQNLWGTITFPDINGDGRADVCGRGNAGVYCGLSTGSRFTYVQLWSDVFNDVAGWGTQPYYWGTIHFADANGDGAKDVVARGDGGLMYGTATKP